jgi:hypothetical protein
VNEDLNNIVIKLYWEDGERKVDHNKQKSSGRKSVLYKIDKDIK